MPAGAQGRLGRTGAGFFLHVAEQDGSCYTVGRKRTAGLDARQRRNEEIMAGSVIRKIKGKIRKFKKKVKGLRAKIKHVSSNSLYIRCLRKKPLRGQAVLLESKGGLDMGGNIFYLLKELASGNYKEFEIYLAVHRSKRQALGALLERYGISGVTMVETGSRDYCRLLATVKYLFNDTTFPAWFIKRDGQVYLNTWHGTPFKMMGRDVWNRAYAIGNVQRNFFLADYLLYPNDYMKEKMLSSYMLNNLWQGTSMLEGYPRNSIFFQPERGRQLKEELGLADRKLIVYMPTWRGVMTNKKSDVQLEAACCYFSLLDELLTDDEIFFVKFHVFTAKEFKFEEYRHIRPFPENCETYDFLNAADVLVTDYSSVFFDFANSGRKIVLFTYDREEYLDERGLYVPIDSLPFPQAADAEQLVREIRSPKEYDDTEFRSLYCKYDNADAARRILCHVLKGVNCCLTERPVANGRENIVIYCANLGRNGITTSLLNIINLVDQERANYYFTFAQSQFRKTPERLCGAPGFVDLLPMSGSTTEKTWTETLAFKLYFSLNVETGWVARKLKELFSREYDKRFGMLPIDKLIHFTGYSPYLTMLFLQSPAKKAIFVHSDIYDEVMEKGNQHLLTLRHAFREYERVVAVSQTAKASMQKIADREEGVQIIENAHFYQGVLDKAKQEFAVDAETQITMDLDDFRKLLKDPKLCRFITIGRFSEEKDHRKLLTAFEQYAKTRPDTVLIIIGGYGPLYRDTVDYAASLECAGRVVIVKAISNPFTILRECDLFLLSSNRDALGLVLLEADTLGIPVVSTDIPGPGDFMRRYHGYLVENSAEGLVSGMEAFERGEIRPLNISFEEYNRDIVQRFERLFD